MILLMSDSILFGIKMLTGLVFLMTGCTVYGLLVFKVKKDEADKYYEDDSEDNDNK